MAPPATPILTALFGPFWANALLVALFVAALLFVAYRFAA